MNFSIEISAQYCNLPHIYDVILETNFIVVVEAAASLYSFPTVLRALCKYCHWCLRQFLLLCIMVKCARLISMHIIVRCHTIEMKIGSVVVYQMD